MYTQCPHCQTIFGVSETHLSAAFGRVRCGHCHGQFNAKRHLLEQIPEQQPETAPPPADENDTNPPENITADEPEHIDLSEPAEVSGTDHAGDDSVAAPETAAIQAEPPLINDSPANEELDAIFAALDHRLEELSGDATVNRYQDPFDAPDDQTEDEIRAGIETIYAEAEAELIKTDTTDTEPGSSQDVPPAPLPAGAEVELIGTDEVPPPEQATSADMSTTEHDTEAEDIDLTTVADENPPPHKDGDPTQVTAEQQDGTPAFEQEELPFALQADLADRPTPRSWPKALGLAGIILLLLAALVFQLALFRNVELAHKLPELKPYLLRFCQYLPCQFTGQRDVKQIQLTSRDVRSHSQGRNTLLISAIFVNRAGFDQPYPDILVTLSDITTTVVARRRFTPQDYLANPQAFQLMKAGKPVHITLEVLDPGNDAVNFQFEFL